MSAADLPSPPSFEELLAQGPLALFLDFDGTLVELASTPDGVAVPARLAQSLAHLASRVEGRLALVSGRSIEDLERHCGPLTVDCAGSHGAERRRADGTALNPPPEALPQEVREEVARFAQDQGIDYEPKPHGAALHSRATPAMEEHCALFMAELAATHGLLVKRGKRVAELVRPGADKGAAVRSFMLAEPFAGSRPVFLGDDMTDEDGFAASADLGGFGIAVGPRTPQSARYGLADSAAVQQWLRL